MKVNRKDLIEVLKKVQPGLATTEIIEQSSSFVFADGRVFTYNDEVAVSHPVQVDLEGAIPAKAFFALLNKTKAEEIGLEVKGGEVRFQGSKAKAGLRLETEIKLPLEELGDIDEAAWFELPEAFCEAIDACMFSVSREDTKPVLTCINFNGQYAESCDNYRLTQFDMGDAGPFADAPVLLPAFAAKALIDFKPIEFAETEGWIHFANEDDVVFSCRTFEDDYPDLDAFLQRSAEGSEIDFPQDINEVLDRAMVFTSTEDRERVEVEAKGGKLRVKAEGADGWLTEDVKIESKDSAEFDISPSFMKAILKTQSRAIVSKQFLRFDAEKFIHVVSLFAKKKS